ncbi:MAG TPA: insulinase family protein [Rubrivivax sp.]|nr:insulinase family protein [Rubrivivax sp.]
MNSRLLRLLAALACGLALSSAALAQLVSTSSTAAASAAQASVSAAAQADAALPPIPEREPAPGDSAQWRRLVLDNGIKVLLLSDPKLNVSSVALAVAAGSLDDPPARQGLAHFLEHMLFLGTAKYPDAAEFDAYLRQNGGSNNAYTAEDHTNYFLAIRHEAFEGALDRFAQFFIAPLLDARYTEREMHAVASEHQKNLENDRWRLEQLQTVAFAPGHPARHFGTGSTQTLAGVSRDELLAFYQQHYSANRMALVLTGRAGLDELEAWARKHFGAIVNRRLPPTVYARDYLPPKAALRMLRMQPIKDLRQLRLLFPLPGQRADWPHKSAELLGFLLGNEGAGSLLAELKARGLATSLSAGADSATAQYGAFELQIDLTPQGLQAVPQVLQTVFAMVRVLREQGLPDYVFHERQVLAGLDERYRDQGEGEMRAATLASRVLDYPLAVAERVPYLWLSEDRAGFAALVQQLRPDNLLVTLVAKGLPADRVEPYYGTRYSYSEDAGAAYAALLDPPRLQALALPPRNPFVPAHTDLQPLQPAHLIDAPGLSLYHAQDGEFQRPQAALLLRQRLPRSLASARNATLLRFYEACVREVLNETTYAAAEAGQHFVFHASLEGVLLAADGWDEATPRLLDAVVPKLGDCTLEPARFADLKDKLVRELSAFETADAYRSVLQTRRALLREFHFTPAQMLPLARAITLDELRRFARGLHAQGKLEALAYGNVGPAEAMQTVRRIAAALGTQAVPEAELLRPRQWMSAPGQTLRSSQALQVNNSTLRREYLLGDDGPRARAIAQVLAAVIAEPFYTEMRTQQQLGYIVQGGAVEDERQTLMLFIIQSGDYGADELERRADAFIATLPSLLEDLPEEAWARVVAGVRARLLERDKSIAERALRLFALAYEHDADWARTQQTLQALADLKREQVAQALVRALDPQTRQLRNFLGYARHHPAPPTLPVTVGDDDAARAAWKAAQRYE